MLLLQEKKIRTLFQRTLPSLALQPRLLVHTTLHTLIQTRPLQSVRNLPPSNPLPIRPLLLDELVMWVYREEHRALLSSSRQLRSTVKMRCNSHMLSFHRSSSSSGKWKPSSITHLLCTQQPPRAFHWIYCLQTSRPLFALPPSSRSLPDGP